MQTATQTDPSRLKATQEQVKDMMYGLQFDPLSRKRDLLHPFKRGTSGLTLGEVKNTVPEETFEFGTGRIETEAVQIYLHDTTSDLGVDYLGYDFLLGLLIQIAVQQINMQAFQKGFHLSSGFRWMPEGFVDSLIKGGDNAHLREKSG